MGLCLCMWEIPPTPLMQKNKNEKTRKISFSIRTTERGRVGRPKPDGRINNNHKAEYQAGPIAERSNPCHSSELKLYHSKRTTEYCIIDT